MEQAKRNLEDKFKTSHLLPPPNGQFVDHHELDDSFDSFESDCDSDGEIKQVDPMLDITNTKLPDPPQQPKQTYAFMQKIKTLGSISKQEITKGLSKIRKKSPKIDKPSAMPEQQQHQQYENTTFYVDANPKIISPATSVEPVQKDEKKLKKKNSRRATTSAIELPYENHDFHTPKVPPTPTVLSSISSPILSHEESSSGTPELLSRKKSKSGRSFKSKLRKSFATESSLSIGSSNYGSSRSTFYISDSVDVDSGIFAGNENKLGTSQEISAAGSADKVDEAVLRSPKSTTPDSGRRRSSTIRPNNPPPPPPLVIEKQRKKSSTSWYAECGVFKVENFNANHRSSKRNGASWYTEAGLYQTSGESVISSSGSSGVSTGGEGGPSDDNLHSMFSNEPLYQIYNATRLESISRDIEIIEDHDGYEEVGLHRINNSEEIKKPQRPSALQLVEPNKGSNRTLWSEVSEVISSGILGE